jgi:periplasmic divalent cation tolerance protein
MDTQYVVVMITAPSKEVGRNVARHLVEQQLAACVNIVDPIESIYSWQGEIQQDIEVLLIAKTRASLVESELVTAVKAVHPYDVPEIIAIPVQAGSKSYLDWISDVTRGTGQEGQ